MIVPKIVASQVSSNIENETRGVHRHILFWIFFLLSLSLLLTFSFIFFNYDVKKLYSSKPSTTDLGSGQSPLVGDSGPLLSMEIAGKVIYINEEEYARYLAGETIPQEKLDSGTLAEDIKGVADYFIKECPESMNDHIYFDFLSKIADKQVLCFTYGIMTFSISQFRTEDWGRSTVHGSIDDIDTENRTLSVFGTTENMFLQEEGLRGNSKVKILCNENQSVILSGYNHEPLYYNVDIFKYIEKDDSMYMFCADQGCGVSQDACIVIKKWESDQL